MPLENPFVFHARFAWETMSKYFRFGRVYWQHRRILRRVERAPGVHMDVAMTPVQDNEFEEMQMYTTTQAARVAVSKLRRHKAPSARVS